MGTTAAEPWVAEVYDVYVTFDGDLAFWREEARRAAGPVLELMCGTGRVSLPLLRAGVPLTCVDLSGPMLRRLAAKAEAEGLAVDLREADVARLDLPNRDFALAILPFGSFAEILGAAAQEAALGRVRAHLRPGGRFVCALNAPSRRRPLLDASPRVVGTHPLPGSSRTLRLSVSQATEPGSTVVRALQRYEILDATGARVEERLLEVRYDLLEPSRFERMACAAGFRVAGLWGDFQRTPFDEARSPYAIFALDVPPPRSL